MRQDLFQKALPGLKKSLSNRLKKKLLRPGEICDKLSWLQKNNDGPLGTQAEEE